MKRPPLHRYATRPGFFLTDDGGADAVIWSENADKVWLCVLETADEPSRFTQLPDAVAIDPDGDFIEQISTATVATRDINGWHETLFQLRGPNYGKWYVHIPQAWDSMRYGYRVSGPWDPRHGLRFNPYKLLLDPCAKGVEGRAELTPEIFGYQCTIDEGSGKTKTVNGSPYGEPSKLDSLGHVPLSVVVDDRDKEGRLADHDFPHIKWSKTVIYELHVKGFTKNAPWLEENLRGTYKGLGDSRTIAYLKDLGITSVELLPIFAKQDEPSVLTRNVTNYWGYSTLSYFSPEESYATAEAQASGARAVLDEVIDMIHALHAADIEVILDVVYNHSCEGGMDGYTLSWAGLDSLSYYRHDEANPGRLIDTTGCGNTFDFSNTHVITAAVDSLRYWAKRVGVDGFRFDLGVTMGRFASGFTRNHPFLYAIRADRLLGNLKLIMEPWDLGSDGWRTGQFGLPFSEWNDHFRDANRKFWLTDVANEAAHIPAEIGMQEMATRMCGSADLFATEPGRGAAASVNYIASHDGFTLGDLTRYAHKHNDANGEYNRDGTVDSYSANFGVEGSSINSHIIEKRNRAAATMLGTLFLSMGTPMLVAGDEFDRTQQGNNNAFCQDNSLSWVDWSWLDGPKDSSAWTRYAMTKKLIELRLQLDHFRHTAFYTQISALGLLKPSSKVQWYMPDGTTPTDSDWFNTSNRSFLMRLICSTSPEDLIIAINGNAYEREFIFPDTDWKQLWSSDTDANSTIAAEETLESETVESGTLPSDNHKSLPPLSISAWIQC